MIHKFERADPQAGAGELAPGPAVRFAVCFVVDDPLTSKESQVNWLTNNGWIAGSTDYWMTVPVSTGAPTRAN